MTSQEFITWLKGFTEGVHDFNITPKQWDLLKERLAEVKDDITSSPFPFGIPNTAPIVTLPHITPGPSTDPYNPFKVTCTSSSFGTTITTTPGTGYITIANPNIASFSTTTSTATSLPSGSAISYTNSTDKTLLND
jgi:hypothetical protein